jgi:hypothetical protein
MNKILCLFIAFLLLVAVFNASLVQSYASDLSQEEKDNIQKCVKILAKDGKLTYPLNEQSDKWLKNQLTEAAYETVVYALRINEAYKRPVEIAGKILDIHGNLFKEQVVLTVESNHVIYEEKINTGKFSLMNLPESPGFGLIARKDGFYSDSTSMTNFSGELKDKIGATDIILYMIPKGQPVNLEWTDFAYILPIDNEITGWSFKRRWYYPADQYDVLMKCYTENEKNAVLEMQEGGGFIKFEGYPRFGSKPDEKMKSFELMIEAPEMGYEQKIIITPELRDIARNQGLYYYFRTPDGKYGKMKIHGFGKGMVNFSYYLNPTGGRSLELKEEINRSPKNPKELYPFPEE